MAATSKEIQAAIASVQTVMRAMPIEFIMSDLCPVDELMHVLGVLRKADPSSEPSAKEKP